MARVEELVAMGLMISVFVAISSGWLVTLDAFVR